MAPVCFDHNCSHLHEMHYKGYITKVLNQCTNVGYYVLKYNLHYKINILHLSTSSKRFCNIPFVMHLPEDGYKCGRNM
jgi:hypothetical protein